MFKIEALGREHNRSSFDFGNDALNSYLKNIARQHLNKGISRIFLIIDNLFPDVILGFYTLAACEIHTGKLPPLPRKYAKKFRHPSFVGLHFSLGILVSGMISAEP